eukprot:699303-Prorocentrum_minimum.AAC.1
MLVQPLVEPFSPCKTSSNHNNKWIREHFVIRFVAVTGAGREGAVLSSRAHFEPPACLAGPRARPHPLHAGALLGRLPPRRFRVTPFRPAKPEPHATASLQQHHLGHGTPPKPQGVIKQIKTVVAETAT